MKQAGGPGHRFGLLFGYTAKTDSQLCYLLEFIECLLHWNSC